MTIAERIKRLRELYNITANDLAKITGIHPVSIRKYETNKMVPGIEVIDKMCDAMKLPRMIFEGIPKQHTDYNFTGDFYQQLFLLLANNTLKVEGKYDPDAKTPSPDTWFSVNPLLSKYIKIKNGDKEIPLEDLSITINTDGEKEYESSQWFSAYLNCIYHAKKALKSEDWDVVEKGETKEDYYARLMDLAEKHQLDLMLTDHSWKEFLKGLESEDKSKLEEILSSGGTYYDFVDQLDSPETQKADLIRAYEDAWIKERIVIEPYPYDKSMETRLEYAEKALGLISQYKKEHPKYKEEIKSYAIEQAKQNKK